MNHTDKLLPTANQTERYREQLMRLYGPYEDATKLVQAGMKKYPYGYYMRFSSENTTNNDARA